VKRVKARSANPDADAVLAEIVRRLVAGFQPERIYLFGSHARGDAGPDSDYDLLMVLAELHEPSYIDAHDLSLALHAQRPGRVHMLEQEREPDLRALIYRAAGLEVDSGHADVTCGPGRSVQLDRHRNSESLQQSPFVPRSAVQRHGRPRSERGCRSSLASFLCLLSRRRSTAALV
jgi:predicted nucleotidyltransferase